MYVFAQTLVFALKADCQVNILRCHLSIYYKFYTEVMSNFNLSLFEFHFAESLIGLYCPNIHEIMPITLNQKQFDDS
jgi:hypothetical protein